jgi:uncharacterized protein
MTNLIYEMLQNMMQEKGIFSNIDIFSILELCSKCTENYDDSHGYDHHIKVFQNCIEILDDLIHEISSQNDKDFLLTLITFSSLLHDTVDHKYQNNNREIIEKFLSEKLSTDEYNYVLWIIDNISYSKEVKNGYPTHKNELVQIARNIVSDADKLEAIGIVGIQRCKEYTESKNPNADANTISSLVIKHFNEKLKTLDNYIHTDKGKKMAIPRMSEMYQYMNIEYNMS